MNITETRDESTLTVALSDRLDSQTAPLLDEHLSEALAGVTKLVLDLDELDYISSAGLRVILAAQKRMTNQGSMTLTNVCPMVMEVFDMTGFSDILTIE